MEVFAALTALVVCYQAAWVVLGHEMWRLEPVLANPRIWMKPEGVFQTSPDGSRSPDRWRFASDVRIIRSPRMSLAITAPPGEELELAVNGVVRVARPIGWRPERYHLTLRPGLNKITAALADATSPTDIEVLDVVFVPAPPYPIDEPRILGIVAHSDGTAALLGTWYPGGQIELELVESDGEVFQASVDDLGLFAVPELDRARLDRTSGLRLTGRGPLRLFEKQAPVQGVPDLSDTLFSSRRIRFVVRRDREVVVDFDVEGLPNEQAQRWRSLAPRRLISDLFGLHLWPLTGFGTTEALTQVEWQPDALHMRLSTTLQAVSFRFDEWGGAANLSVQSRSNTSAPFLHLPGDEMELQVDPGIEVWRRAATPTGEGSFLWHGPQSDAGPHPIFALRLSARDEPRDRVDSDAPSTVAELSRRLQQLQAAVPDQPRRLLEGMLEAVPLIGLLILVLRAQALSSVTRRTLIAAGGSLLAFHFLILTPWLFRASFDSLLLFAEATQHDVRTFLYLLTNLGRGSNHAAWALAAALLLGPVFESLRRRTVTPTRKRRGIVRWLVFAPFALLVPATFVVAAWWIQVLGHALLPTPHTNLSATTTVIATVLVAWPVIAFFLSYLLHTATRRRLPRRTVVRASGAMLILPLVPALTEGAMGVARQTVHTITGHYPPLLPAPVGPLVWVVIIAGVGAALLYHLSKLFVRLLPWRPAVRFLRPPWRSLFLLVVFAACLPLGSVIGAGGHRTVASWDLSHFTYQVAGLVPYLAALALALLVVRTNPRDSFEISRPARLAGTLLFAFYLCGRTANLWFVPIPLLVGWLLFDRWVLRSPATAPPGTAERTTLVQRILDWRRAQRLAEQLNKAFEKSLEKILIDGKASLEAVQARLLRARNAAERARSMLPGGVAGARLAVFGTGAGSGPWENARVALLYGSGIAVPFVALRLAEAGGDPLTSFPFLQLATMTIAAASTWLLLAFLFGYFFHSIRGRDGLLKALVLSAAFTAATVPFRLLHSQPLFGTTHLIEIIRVVLFVLLLALLAFDLRILRTLGFRRRDFLAVHGVSTAAGYLGSILVASAASYLGSDLLPALAKKLLPFGD